MSADNLQRKEHLTDTRAKTVGLTDEGVKIILMAVGAVENFDKEFFSLFGNKITELNNILVILLGQK